MRVDLTAGTVYAQRAMPLVRPPTILVFDSGVGGLTVFREVTRARPDARFVYVADDAAFPYGRLDRDTLVARVCAVLDRLIARHTPDLVVIACNTASTLVLPALRARHAIPFVGTVPAIKPAVERSRTRHVAVLATPGTVKRDYTHALIAAYAGDCRVTLVGAEGLAPLAEAFLRGEAVSDDDLCAEIAPCFSVGNPPTDTVVLGCTHYPLLVERLAALTPWPVTWIDPAPAIARRVVQLLGDAIPGAPDGQAEALFTGTTPGPALQAALAGFGLERIAVDPLPLA